jgi:hypothetical protein
MLNLIAIVAQLKNQAEIIRSLMQGFTDEQVRWKPDAKSWSLLEVINHLGDEEREDFRDHVDCLLHDKPWNLIDPQGWVAARGYNQRDPAQSLADFLHERQQSLAWLAGLDAPDWDRSRQAPWGVIHAGDVLASWVAHDLLHIRQLLELRWALHREAAKPYDVQYAGEW